jgi:hypothetical protein
VSILLGFLLNKHLPRGGARPIDVQRAQATGIERREEARRLRQEQGLDDDTIAQILGVQPEIVSQELTGVLPPELVPPTAGGDAPLAQLLAEAEVSGQAGIAGNIGLPDIAQQSLQEFEIGQFERNLSPEQRQRELRIVQQQKRQAIARESRAEREREDGFERSVRQMEIDAQSKSPAVQAQTERAIRTMRVHRAAKQSLDSGSKGPSGSVQFPSENGPIMFTWGDGGLDAQANILMNRVQANAEALFHMGGMMEILRADPKLVAEIGSVRKFVTGIRDVVTDFAPTTQQALRNYNESLATSILLTPDAYEKGMGDTIQQVHKLLADPVAIGQLDAFELLTAIALARANAGTNRVSQASVEFHLNLVKTSGVGGVDRNLARLKTTFDSMQRQQRALEARLGNIRGATVLKDDIVRSLLRTHDTTLAPGQPAPARPAQPRRFRFEEDPNRQPDIIVDPGTGAIRDR